jgi:flavin reductase
MYDAPYSVESTRLMNWIEQRPDDAMAGAFEAFAPAELKAVDPVPFREGMARLGAAVNVITTAGSAGRAGFTATAVCSVSDQPPTLLVCLNRRSRGTPVLRENGVFCVNTLGANSETIADTFAGRGGAAGEERFKVGDWTKLATGAPVLLSAAVAFDCRVIDVKTVATHNVFFAVVEAVHLGDQCPALVYHERCYKRV